MRTNLYEFYFDGISCIRLHDFYLSATGNIYDVAFFTSYLHSERIILLCMKLVDNIYQVVVNFVLVSKSLVS